MSERSGPREGLILLVFTVLTLAATAYVLVTAEIDARDDPAQKAARGEIDGLDDLSLLRAENLQRVVDEVAGGKRPLILSLRVSATSVSVTVRDPDGYRKILTFDPGFDYEEDDNGVGEDEFFEPGEIDARAPERMARRVAELTGLPVEAVDYVTISPAGSGAPTWYMALDEGPARHRQWVAQMDGSDLRKPGEPPRSAR